MSVNVLLSFFYHEKTDLQAIRADLVCGRLMIDSGAFSAFTLGVPVDRLAYAEYLERWAGRWDYAITLDVIGDPATTAVNTRWLHDRGLPVLPVFTPGMKLPEFDAMVADVGYVAVGGLVPLPREARVKRVQMLQRRAQEAGGGIHALGVGALSTVKVARPYSSDSSSLSAAFVFGVITVFDGRNVRSISVSDRAKLVKNHDLIRRHGIDLADLLTTGRMPAEVARSAMVGAMSIAYACADEYVKQTWSVPGPAGDQAGPHLYQSLTTAWLAKDVAHLDRQLHPDAGPHLYMSLRHDDDAIAVATLDRELHDGTTTPPRLWAAYGHAHQHTNRKATPCLT